jgi:hypothetical protein
VSWEIFIIEAVWIFSAEHVAEKESARSENFLLKKNRRLSNQNQ